MVRFARHGALVLAAGRGRRRGWRCCSARPGRLVPLELLGVVAVVVAVVVPVLLSRPGPRESGGRCAAAAG